MKHPIYRPIAIGALLALASLGARAGVYKDASIEPQQAPVIKLSHDHHAAIMPPA